MLHLGLSRPCSSPSLYILVEGRLLNLGLLVYFVIKVCFLSGGAFGCVIHLIVLDMVQIFVVTLAKASTSSLLERGLNSLI